MEYFKNSMRLRIESKDRPDICSPIIVADFKNGQLLESNICPPCFILNFFIMLYVFDLRFLFLQSSSFSILHDSYAIYYFELILQS